MTTLLFALLLIVLIWLGVLTAFFLRLLSFSKKIETAGKDKSLTGLLNEVLYHEKDNAKQLKEVLVRCESLEKSGSFHLQRLGLVRFNPFKDTGGDQSFILALLDEHDTGIVISSLHTRTGTRWYAKKVENGKGIEYELSEDEAKAIKGAKEFEKG